MPPKIGFFRQSKPFSPWAFGMVLFMAGCTSQNKPTEARQVLSAYISKSVALSRYQDRESLYGMTSGAVRRMLETMDEPSFKQAFMDTKRKFVSMKVRDERAVAPDRVVITYELICYEDISNRRDLIILRKMATLVNQGGTGWKIDDVHTIKTNLERQTPVAF